MLPRDIQEFLSKPALQGLQSQTMYFAEDQVWLLSKYRLLNRKESRFILCAQQTETNLTLWYIFILAQGPFLILSLFLPICGIGEVTEQKQMSEQVIKEMPCLKRKTQTHFACSLSCPNSESFGNLQLVNSSHLKC